jgi:gas vesicle protein
MRQYGRIVHRIVFSFLGIIFCSVVVASRASVSPNLLTGSYSKIAGLEIVSFLVVLVIGVIFGAITALCIRLFLGSKEESTKGKLDEKAARQLSAGAKVRKLQMEDRQYFLDMEEELYPLHYDIFGSLKEIVGEDQPFAKKDRDIKDSLLQQSVDPLQVMQIQKNIKTEAETAQPQPQHRVTMTNTFTKDQADSGKKAVDLSAMKFHKLEHFPDNDDDSIDRRISANSDNNDELPELLKETRKSPRGQNVHSHAKQEGSISSHPQPQFHSKWGELPRISEESAVPESGIRRSGQGDELIRIRSSLLESRAGN